MQKKSKVKSLLICESRDEIDYIKDIISNFNELQVIGGCTSTSNALELILKHKPDLIITDTQIKNESIDNILALNKKYTPFIILISNDFTVETIQKCLKYNLVDYLKKPTSEIELIQSLLKLKSIYKVVLQSEQSNQNNTQTLLTNSIYCLTEQNNYRSINLVDIVEINLKTLQKSIITLTNHEEINVNKSFKQIFDEIRVHPNFIRTGKSQIVNKDYIDTIVPSSNSIYITLSNQNSALVNKAYRKDVLIQLQLKSHNYKTTKSKIESNSNLLSPL